jgi:uncharacterized RDD family membrane protein YckC
MINQQNILIYAGFRRRLFAGLIDCFILLPIFFTIIYFFGNSDYQMIKIDEDFYGKISSAESHKNKLLDYAGYAISIAYLAFFLSTKNQATIGKKLLKIYVDCFYFILFYWSCFIRNLLLIIITNIFFNW